MVKLGIHLRELCRARVVWVPSLVIAGLLALSSMNTTRLYGAHTQILVNEPKPGILSTATGINNYDWLNGALLLGNILTSDPGDDYVARAAHVPVTSITFNDPQSYFLPSPDALPAPGTPPYTVSAVSDPSVPMVDVYATAPTQAMALRLVNAAYWGLRDYLSGPGSTEPSSSRSPSSDTAARWRPTPPRQSPAPLSTPSCTSWCSPSSACTSGARCGGGVPTATCGSP